MGAKCVRIGKVQSYSPKRMSVQPSNGSDNNHGEPGYGEDVRRLLPESGRSRPLYNRFSNRGGARSEYVDMNSRIPEVREDNLRMESLLLRQNRNVPIGRCSTPDPNYCWHCEQNHRQRCCMYYGDPEDDVGCYSTWTEKLENPSIKPQRIANMPEVVSSGTTPSGFPRYTYVRPEPITERMTRNNDWMQQVFEPFGGSEGMPESVDDPRTETLPPYEQYILHLRQLNEMLKSPEEDLPPDYNPQPQQIYPHIPQPPQPLYSFNFYNGPIYVQQDNQIPYLQHTDYNNPQIWSTPYYPPPPAPIGHHLRPQPREEPQQYPQNYYYQSDPNPPPPYPGNPTSQLQQPLWMMFWNNRKHDEQNAQPYYNAYQIADGLDVPMSTVETEDEDELVGGEYNRLESESEPSQ